MIIPLILTTSLTHFSLNGWENVIFELGSERVGRGDSPQYSDETALTLIRGPCPRRNATVAYWTEDSGQRTSCDMFTGRVNANFFVYYA